MKAAEKERLMQRLEKWTKKTKSGCWRWTGSIGGGTEYPGYPVMEWMGRRVTVRRFVYGAFKSNRELSAAYQVRATCGSTLCCNPEHLYTIEKSKGGRPKSDGKPKKGG